LRENGNSVYKIPEGGMFNLVSSPNYLGEILEWTGWAIATWSLAGLSFALWTFANLAPRALANHRWVGQLLRGVWRGSPSHSGLLQTSLQEP